jgi:serpin B
MCSFYGTFLGFNCPIYIYIYKPKTRGEKMKKAMSAVLVMISFLFFVVLSQGCAAKHTPASVTGADNSATIQSCVPKKGNNVFAGDFYAKCKDTTSGNVFFSPYSIFSALSMTYEGAKGATADQMAAVLHLPSDSAARLAGFVELMGAINAPGKNYTLSTANNLWLQTDFTVYPSYTSVLTQYYLATITLLDFVNDTENSRLTINNTVANETNNKITDLLPSGTITNKTRLVLTNAIYMKADWAIKFKAALTITDNFNTTASTPVKVSMMSQTLGGSIEDYYGAAQVYEMPYVNNELSMFIFLPLQGQMAGLESVMTGNKLNDWFAARTAPAALIIGGVEVILPKFTFTENYDLTSVLPAMGMPLAFSETGADFTGIAKIPGKNLYISKVLHKAFVSVDEAGTEAAAATAVIITVITSIATQPLIPQIFRVDHPFIFVIRENTTNAILFMGRVMDPTAN